MQQYTGEVNIETYQVIILYKLPHRFVEFIASL